MDKRFWEKSCRYSIRKLTVGTASVLLGAVFLSSHTVSADGIEVQQNDPSIVETTIKPDSGSEQIDLTETTKPALAESPVSESKATEETQTTNRQASEEAIVEAKENKENKNTELPVTKQENYQLNYDQPTAPSYDGWEKQALPVGNGEADARENVSRTVYVVFEREVFYLEGMSLKCFVNVGIPCSFRILLVSLCMNFVHTVKADAHVLPRIDKLNELFHGAVELPDDVLHRQHHAEGHAAVYHGRGGKNGNQNILHLVDGDAPRLLYLLQVQGLQIDFEKVGLHVFPFPTLSLFTALQLDFLHAAYELIGYVAVATCLFKVFVVQLPALFEEEDDPACVKRSPKKENKEDAEIIDCEDNTEH